MAKLAIISWDEGYGNFLKVAAETQGHQVVKPGDADIAVIFEPDEGDVRELASKTKAKIIVIGAPLSVSKATISLKEGAHNIIELASFNERNAIADILEAAL